MKIITILGSPRKEGNTATVLGWIEQRLQDQGHEIERISVSDYTMNGCMECRVCSEHTDEPGCPQEDDVTRILDKIIKSDAVVYSSPLFCWSWPAQMKALIDRHFGLVKHYGLPDYKSFLNAKPVGLVITSAGPVEGNAELLIKQFQLFAQYINVQVKAQLAAPFCTTPDQLVDMIKKQATSFAEQLVS